jgi:hypothetical protein
VGTPVGYRCKSCINAQQKVFYAEFRPIHYLIAAVVALPLSVLAGILVPSTGWFTVALGPLAGTGIAEISRWAIRRRRGRYTWVIVCVSVVFGGILPLLAMVGLTVFVGVFGGLRDMMSYAAGGLFSMLWNGVYLVTATGAAYWRLRPGKRV